MIDMMEFTREQTSLPCVYLVLDEWDFPIYVGLGKMGMGRALNRGKDRHGVRHLAIAEGRKTQILFFRTVTEAIQREKDLIQKWGPKYNTQGLTSAEVASLIKSGGRKERPPETPKMCARGLHPMPNYKLGCPQCSAYIKTRLKIISGDKNLKRCHHGEVL